MFIHVFLALYDSLGSFDFLSEQLKVMEKKGYKHLGGGRVSFY